MYAVAYGQCSEAMQAKMESNNGFEAAADALDVVLLLKLIKKIAYQYESQRYPHQAVHTAMFTFYLTSQNEGMTLEAHINEFNNQKDVV
eukprot:5574450-Ditylum_brightwellii.AAC.1